MTPRVPVAMMQAGKERILRTPSFFTIFSTMSVASASFWAVNPPALPICTSMSSTVMPLVALMSFTGIFFRDLLLGSSYPVR